ncbi:hypothetical protein BDZ94DRAFT_1237667 [Collybia nuda]|uniref:Uncharacterized protein n=1 Tax=Collybia nuda TaxID=64659 RepID=A0A9P5Y356_9AGAR|nr:hypothetical protein BDZ94DRAFT_1237667 [Collybia nuda]
MEKPSFDLLSAENFGSVVVGFTISLILSGVVITQGYTYFRFSVGDGLYLKILAGTVLILSQWSQFLPIGGHIRPSKSNLSPGPMEAFFDVPMVPNTITVLSKFDWLITLAFVIGAVGDVIIAASFCYYLKRLAPQEGFRSLMLGIIQTGMVTRCLAFSDMVRALYDQYQTLNMRRGLREKYTPGNNISQIQFPVIVTSGNPLEDCNTALHLIKV